MTVGVVGYGHIGAKVVRILKAFGCRILVCDPYVQLSRRRHARTAWNTFRWSELLAESDVVTLHARGHRGNARVHRRRAVRRDEAGRLFRQHRARAAGRLRRAVRMRCASRHLRRRDLKRSASSRSRRTGAAAAADNVTLTPHIAGASVKTVKFAAEAAAEEVRRYSRGRAAAQSVLHRRRGSPDAEVGHDAGIRLVRPASSSAAASTAPASRATPPGAGFGAAVREGRSGAGHIVALRQARFTAACAISNITSSAWCARR